MNHSPTFTGLCWSTAAQGAADTLLPLDRAALGEHLERCRGAAGRGFAWRCGAEAVHGFVATRFVTTLLALLALLAGAAWMLA